MTEWFRRKNQNINTPTKRDTKEGMWIKCPDCGEVVYSNLLISTYYLCSSCSYHFNYSSQQYIDLLLDKEDRINIGNNIFSNDVINSVFGFFQCPVIRISVILDKGSAKFKMFFKIGIFKFPMSLSVEVLVNVTCRKILCLCLLI